MCIRDRIEHEGGESKCVEHPQVVESVTDVPGIAVEDDDQAACPGAGGDKPAVEGFAVASGEFQCNERQADTWRAGPEAAIDLWQEHQRGLPEIDQGHQAEIHQQKNLECRPQHERTFHG